MTAPDVKTARLWFASIDADGSGSLNAEELRRALELGRLNFSLSQVHQFIRAFDYEGNRTLDVNEFIQLHRFLSEVHDCFAAAGRRGPFLPASDVPAALARLGFQLEPQPLQSLLRRYDVGQRGGLVIEEFLGCAFFLLSARRVFSRFGADPAGRIALDFNQFCYAAAHMP